MEYSCKCLFDIADGLGEEASLALGGKSKKGGKSKMAAAGGGASEEPSPAITIKVTLSFKRYIYDPKKLMIQDK